MSSQALFDVIVVGSGHAGCEALLAASRMGCNTAVVTLRPERSGWMPCNPAIGGVGKGHLVREIDALGGEMGLNADATGIMFKRLNTRKGPAVQARRCQSDMFAYSERMVKVLEKAPNLTIIAAGAAGFHMEDGKLAGVLLDDGAVVRGRTVVVTTGTFLRGLLHTGHETVPGGRVDEPPSNSLSMHLKNFGLPLLRLKTGTPPRLDSRTINYEGLEVQEGDDPPQTFSFLTKDLSHIKQVACHITYTNEQTHDIIRDNILLSPMYSGKIEGTGPRYCPSVEDKVVRFPDRIRHQVFLEPVALNSPLVYPNGISTSLPLEVQKRMVASVPGLENAEIINPGYAVEYDAVDPRSLHPWLELKEVPNLFLAGQINGTSGYEEAGAQGLIAGANAALRVMGKDPFTLDRSQAYIGVMIDDLTTRGAPEPYRMFTSRAEYRLLLREDNADLRLTEIGRGLGLVDDVRWQRYEEKQEKVAKAEAHCRSITIRGGEAGREDAARLGQRPLKQPLSLFELLGRNEVTEDVVRDFDESLQDEESEVLQHLLIQQTYAGYLQRQEREAKTFRESEAVLIPEDMDYDSVPGLRFEIREILNRTRPRSLGQASRIPGITPASLQLLTVMLAARRRSLQEENNSTTPSA